MSTETAAAVAPVAPVETPTISAIPAAPAGPDASLLAAVADHTAQIRGLSTVPPAVAKAPELPLDAIATGKQDAAVETTPPADEAKEAAGDEPAALQGQPDEPPAEPAVKPAPPAEDAVAKNIARYLRQQREVKVERANLARDREAFQAEQQARAKEMEALQRFQSAKAKDPVTAVEELLGEDTLQGTFVLDLMERMKQKDPATPLSQEKVIEIASQRAAALNEAKMREQQEQSAKAQAARQQEQIDRNKEVFFTGLQTQFLANAANAEKYPYLAAAPVETPEVDDVIQAHFAATKQIPTPDMIFAHFDKMQERKAQKLLEVARKRAGGTAPAAPTAAKSATRAPVVATVDSRGRPSTPPKGETLEEQRARIVAQLDGLDRSRR